MATIELTSHNITSQMRNMSQILDSGKYIVTVSIVPKEEMSLSEYLLSGVHTDQKFGPFCDDQSLFASLDR